MRSAATKNYSSFLLAILLLAVETCLVLHQIPVVLAVGLSTITTTTDDVADDDASYASPLDFTTSDCDSSLQAPIILPCPDQELLKISYVSRGSIKCGGALSLEQAKISPSIRADPSIVDPDGLYSLVLVDTTEVTAITNTFFTPDSIHPILHYGAVNVEGSILLQGLSLDRTDKLDVFSPYQKPSPPEPNTLGAAEGVESALFAYEFMLAAQSAPVDVPELRNVQNFDYEAFFDDVVGVGFSNLAANTYFLSGHCVATTVSGRQNPTDVPTTVPSAPPTTAMDPTPTPTAAIAMLPTTAPTKSSAVQAQSTGDVEVESLPATEPPTSDEESGGETRRWLVAMGTGLLATWLSYDYCY